MPPVQRVKFYQRKIYITRGIEVEMQSIRANIERKGVDPFLEFMEFSLSREDADFGRLKLGELFSLFGLDEGTGQRVENLLPRIITESPEFIRRFNAGRSSLPEFLPGNPDDWLPSDRMAFAERLATARAQRLPFEVTFDGQHYWIKNFERLSGENLKKTLQFLFDISGVSSEALVLEKKPGAWIDKTNPSDLLIPNRVVIETRNGKSAGLEVPMAGAVHTEKEVKDYIKNLWLRLGLFEKGEDNLVDQAAKETLIR